MTVTVTLRERGSNAFLELRSLFISSSTNEGRPVSANLETKELTLLQQLNLILGLFPCAYVSSVHVLV